MARPKKQQPKPKPPASQPKQVEIVPDGDYAGMAVDDVLRLTADRVGDCLGELDIDTAGAALDMAVGDYLHVTNHAEGPLRAKEAALAFMTTAFPYSRLDIPADRVTYKALREGLKK